MERNKDVNALSKEGLLLNFGAWHIKEIDN